MDVITYTHKILTRSSSGNRLRGLWLQIFIIYGRRSGFSNKLDTSLKIVHNFLIVRELVKATFEDLYIFSFDYLLKQVIPDINDSMRENILPYIKTGPFLENFEGMYPCHTIVPQAYKLFACIWVVRTSLWESWIFLSNHTGAFYILKSVI